MLAFIYKPGDPGCSRPCTRIALAFSPALSVK
jgi:hypothetical protein